MSNQSTRKAMIVGINEYLKKEKIPALSGAENDANEIYELLKDEHIGEFSIKDDHFLKGETATCEKIRQALSDLFWNDETCDLILFFFSGHGFKDGYGNGYIAPYNVDVEHPFVNGINFSELKNIIFNSPNKRNVIVILDCCYSGIAAKHDKEIKISAKDTILNLNDKEKDQKKWMGKYILASCEEEKKSRENDFSPHGTDEKPHYHGILSYFLIEGLNGLAAESGRVSLGKLKEYMEANINKKEDDQKLIFFAGESSFMNNLRICWDAGKIKKEIDEVKDLLINANPINLIIAIGLIKKINKQYGNISPAIIVGEEIKKEISKINLQDCVCHIYDANTISLRKSLASKPHLLKKIIKFNSSMNYDQILDLNDNDINLLIHFCELGTDMDLNGFLSILNSTYEKNEALGSMKQIGDAPQNSQK